MFALVDCNNFYASCERVFRPDLNGKPVAVLSNNDGCVIARSNEAKALGIPMGAPAFKFKEIFEANNINVFSSNYALYGDMSNRVMTLLKEFTPEVEVYSIDEAFLKFSGFQRFDLDEYGSSIRSYVTRCSGIPISLGFAPTKGLAKVANKIAKKYPERTNGVYAIKCDQSRIKALKWLKIEDVWGIGRQHAKRLQGINVYNAYQFTLLPDEWVQKNMSIVGLRLKRELQGVDTLDMEYAEPKKNIATTRSFDVNYNKLEQLEERVATFTASCAEKLRRQSSNCYSLMVFVHTNSHRNDLKQYSKNIVIQLPYATNSSITLTKYALIGLRKIFKKGFEYKKAGVIVMDIVPVNPYQINLFDNKDDSHASIMTAIDKINKSCGMQKVRLATQGTGRTWRMRQEKLSPRYTTNLSEIIKVNC